MAVLRIPHRGYSLKGQTSGTVNGDCVSAVSKGMVLTFASTAATATSDWFTETTTLTGSSSVGAIAIVGYNAERAASSTSSPEPSENSSSSTSGLPPTSSSATQSATASAFLQSTSANGGLSPGTKAGIGLGVSLGVIGIVALIVAIVMLRRRHREETEPPEITQVAFESEYKPAAIASTSVPAHIPVAEPSYELHNHSRAQEMSSQQPHSPVEMGNHHF